MQKIHTLGVLGVGVWGCHSLEREFLATGRCRVKTICHQPEFGARLELDPSAYAEELGASMVTSPEDILNDPEIDIVSAMISPKAKNQWIIRALEAGKAVFLDKPLALDRDSAIAIMEAEKRSGALVGILGGYHTRPAIEMLMEKLASGDWGQLKALNLRLNFSGGIYPGFAPSTQWRDEIFGGESVTIGSHAVITAMKIAGSRIVRSQFFPKQDFYQSYRECRADDYAIFNLKFANDVVANISVGRLPYRIQGEDILLEATAEKGYARLAGTQLSIYPENETFDCPFNGAEISRKNADRFLDALEDGKLKPFTSAEDGVALFDAFGL
ncbi:MAG: Gfo/Idh/MocA family oxidoreductase [Victivallales bacterium]|nr:Gfo/Idh/MocA family oxidoreductase [Victivallales bacterium]